MDFPQEIEITLKLPGLHAIGPRKLIIRGGITTFVGPNGSGKTQLLRGAKGAVSKLLAGKKPRYISAGRLGPLERYRSDFDGQRGDHIRYDDATFGDKSSMSRRHRTETVLGDFASLSERPDILIKVQARLRRLFRRDIRIDWDGGTLRVYFNRTDGETAEYGSAREASGLLHLVATLSALYDDEVGCTLIDEPEVSLHPQLQAFLYQEMRKVAGDPSEDRKKLVLLSTHSTEFINVRSIDDLASIVFCNDIQEDPVQVDPTNPEFRDRKISALLARMGQEHKRAFFCKKPLLVEGISDQILCSGLSRQLDINLDASGSQILPVSGKGQMPTVVKLLRNLGKEPAILTDADALADGLGVVSAYTSLTKADMAAHEMAHRDAPSLARIVYRDFVAMVSENWNDIAASAERHRYWRLAEKNDEEILKRRSALAVLLGEENDHVLEIENGKQWSGIRIRLLSLLDILSTVGCFVLRRGTIEDYYQYTSEVVVDEKPNAAVYESNQLYRMNDSRMREAYGDLVSAIEFVGEVEKVDEKTAVRDLVLAIAGPTLANAADGATAEQVRQRCKSILGKTADLFEIYVDQECSEKVRIGLASQILDVEGFPLQLDAKDNLISVVGEKMKLT